MFLILIINIVLILRVIAFLIPCLARYARESALFCLEIGNPLFLVDGGKRKVWTPTDTFWEP